VRVEIAATRGAFSLEVAFEVERGRTLALLGPNGAGKSTTLAAIAGTIDYTGSISVRSGDGSSRILDDLPTEKRRVGVVFQDYLLFPHLSVLENVAFGPRSVGVTKRAARAAASALLERLGIGELAGAYPRSLSGGQGQRVALARALAASPDVLLLDEPLAALDVEIRDEVRAELAAHLADFAGATIVITHSLADVTALAADVVVLEQGRVTQRGSVPSLLEEPATAWIERLVSSRNGS
jgi:molybdate transport system ATP-binding protein